MFPTSAGIDIIPSSVMQYIMCVMKMMGLRIIRVQFAVIANPFYMVLNQMMSNQFLYDDYFCLKQD